MVVARKGGVFFLQNDPVVYAHSSEKTGLNCIPEPVDV
jgi:hypothetical protein